MAAVMGPPESLLKAADESPCEDGGLALLALADWYEESGEGGMAYALRWMHANGKHPRRTSTTKIYEWWDASSRPTVDRIDPQVNLPASVWRAMPALTKGSECHPCSSIAVTCELGFVSAVRLLASALSEAPKEKRAG